MIVLAFETSCDETCASVVECAPIKVRSNVVSSQIEIHKLYGGVVPEIASRNHAMAILGVCEEAIERAGIKLSDVTHVAATTFPGLRGAVMVGQIFGQSLANALRVPFIPVNHLDGHMASVLLSEKTPGAGAPPPLGKGEDFEKREDLGNGGFLSLLVSGGHTALYHVKSWGEKVLLCETADDAVGEAFDKVAKVLGLEYPGGVKIEALAREFAEAGEGEGLITFVKNPRAGAFSYSGLKTAVLNYVNHEKMAGRALDLPRICASFQHEAVKQLCDKVLEWLERLWGTTSHKPPIGGKAVVAVCGGVSANGYLRTEMARAVGAVGGAVVFPPFEYCTDNASMIGCAAGQIT